MQLAAREHRFEDVGRVDCPLRRAGPYDGVQLVKKQNDLALRVGDFLEDRFQTLFELTSILRPRDERAHVERDNPFVLESFGYVTTHDPLR